MITYKDLFKVLKQLPESGNIRAEKGSDIYRKLLILDRAEIAQAAQEDEDIVCFYFHPKQIKPSTPTLVVDIRPVSAPPSDLGRVHVDWSGRGHSSGSYRVKADKGNYLEIAFELDVERVMTVAKTRTKAA